MALTSSQKAFIEKIAPCAQSAYKSIGKVKPSVCIGMACVESAYGSSSKMASHNAYFGQKVGTGKTATKYWSGKFFTTQTSEEYVVGKHTIIQAAFRAYDNMQQGVNNYYELLNTSLYSKVSASADYKTQMFQIKACGYMTSSTEVNSVIKIIEANGLTKYDNISTSSVKYFAKYTGTSYKIDEVLTAIKAPEKYIGSKAKRKPIAAANGITNYVANATQNIQLVNLAKAGKLVQPQ